MKVCFLVTKYPISGGGQVNLNYLINFYKKNNIDVKIYTDCKISLSSLKRFLSFIKNEKVDIIQTIDLRPEFLFNAIFARVSGKKIIFSCVGKLSEEQGFLTRLIANIFSNKITVLSRLFKNKFIFKNKVSVIPNGIDLEKFRYSNTKKEKIILSVGRIDPIKNFEWLLNVSKSFEDYKILIIGNIHNQDYHKKLVEIIKNEKIKNVKFLHNVEHKDIQKYYKISKICVLTSIYEMFPAVILEAMACGTPVIARKIPNITDIVNDNAILVETKDELENMIKKIIEDKKLYKVMQKKGIKLAKKYGIENMLNAYKKVLMIV